MEGDWLGTLCTVAGRIVWRENVEGYCGEDVEGGKLCSEGCREIAYGGLCRETMEAGCVEG